MILMDGVDFTHISGFVGLSFSLAGSQLWGPGPNAGLPALRHFQASLSGIEHVLRKGPRSLFPPRDYGSYRWAGLVQKFSFRSSGPNLNALFSPNCYSHWQETKLTSSTRRCWVCEAWAAWIWISWFKSWSDFRCSSWICQRSRSRAAGGAIENRHRCWRSLKKLCRPHGFLISLFFYCIVPFEQCSKPGWTTWCSGDNSNPLCEYLDFGRDKCLRVFTGECQLSAWGIFTIRWVNFGHIHWFYAAIHDVSFRYPLGI